MIPRRTLQFSSIDEVLADIAALREGYTQSGNWSLPQACWHLNASVNHFMAPFVGTPPVVTEQMRQALQQVLMTGKIPDRLDAPEKAVPPGRCTDADVATFVETLQKYNKFSGPFAPHRLFGAMSIEQRQRHTLIHIAHHLSFLSPQKPN
jgi:uncharacterized damage-inducible protein DinB